MIFKIEFKNLEDRIKYYDWITETGVSCTWNYAAYNGKTYMIIHLEDEDATPFKLKFGL